MDVDHRQQSGNSVIGIWICPCSLSVPPPRSTQLVNTYLEYADIHTSYIHHTYHPPPPKKKKKKKKKVHVSRYRRYPPQPVRVCSCGFPDPPLPRPSRSESRRAHHTYNSHCAPAQPPPPARCVRNILYMALRLLLADIYGLHTPDPPGAACSLAGQCSIHHWPDVGGGGWRGGGWTAARVRSAQR